MSLTSVSQLHALDGTIFLERRAYGAVMDATRFKPTGKLLVGHTRCNGMQMTGPFVCHLDVPFCAAKARPASVAPRASLDTYLAAACTCEIMCWDF